MLARHLLASSAVPAMSWGDRHRGNSRKICFKHCSHPLFSEGAHFLVSTENAGIRSLCSPPWSLAVPRKRLPISRHNRVSSNYLQPAGLIRASILGKCSTARMCGREADPATKNSEVGAAPQSWRSAARRRHGLPMPLLWLHCLCLRP